jgi:Transglutaminase-like superfamily
VSDPHIPPECAFTPRIACIDGLAWLDEHQFDLMFRVGLVLDTFRDHEHLPCGQLNRAYGIVPTDARLQALSSRSVAEQLHYIQAVDDRPLAVPRPVSSRLLGSCRDFALLVCGVLRHHGVPARVRCGFATYLGPNRYEDHWICEHWMQRQHRWSIVDS